MKQKVKNIFKFCFIWVLLYLLLKPVFAYIEPRYGVSVNVSDSLPGKLFFIKKGNNHNFTIKDIVIFKLKKDKFYPNKLLAKRIIGIGGDKIRRENNYIVLKDKLYLEIKERSREGEKLTSFTPEQDLIADNNFFVSGEHFDSYDSRYFGVIKKSEILGKVWIIL